MLYTHLFQLAVLGPPQPVTGHSIIPTLQTSIIDKLVTQVHNIPEIAKLYKSHQQDVKVNVKMDINLNLLAFSMALPVHSVLQIQFERSRTVLQSNKEAFIHTKASVRRKIYF